MTRHSRFCYHECPGGNQCNLNSYVNHVLHICADSGCYCRSNERYYKERNGRPFANITLGRRVLVAMKGAVNRESKQKDSG